MADKTKAEQPKYKADDLVIVQKDQLPVLDMFPVGSLNDETYRRIEKLACWFVLRAPLTEITRLANPSLIDLFKSDKNPKQGSRTNNRSEFEISFLTTLDLDCTEFEFIYSRRAMKPQLVERDLAANDSSVFKNVTERCVCFVGKGETGKEDSCIESICRHVRNGFAHGRIAVKEEGSEPMIFIEDGTTPRDVDYGPNKPVGQKLEVRFRLVVRLSTLERWYGLLMDDNARL